MTEEQEFLFQMLNYAFDRINNKDVIIEKLREKYLLTIDEEERAIVTSDLNTIKMLVKRDEETKEKLLMLAVKHSKINVIKFMMSYKSECHYRHDDVILAIAEQNNKGLLKMLGDTDYSYKEITNTLARYGKLDMLKFSLENDEEMWCLEALDYALENNKMDVADVIYNHAMETEPTFFQDYLRENLDDDGNERISSYLETK